MVVGQGRVLLQEAEAVLLEAVDGGLCRGGDGELVP